jgi:hypothetical protein
MLRTIGDAFVILNLRRKIFRFDPFLILTEIYNDFLSNHDHIVSNLAKIWASILTSFSHRAMRIGRPSFHIPARWITIDLPIGSSFYELDHTGRLQRVNGEIRPHHIALAAAPARQPSHQAISRVPSPVVLPPPMPIQPIVPAPIDNRFDLDWFGEAFTAPAFDLLDDAANQIWDQGLDLVF